MSVFYTILDLNQLNSIFNKKVKKILFCLIYYYYLCIRKQIKTFSTS